MLERRYFSIRKKRVTPENLERIIAFAQEEHKHLLSKHQDLIKNDKYPSLVRGPIIKLEIKTQDNVDYIFNSSNITTSINLLQLKVIKGFSLYLDYNDYTIDIEIEHSNSSFNSSHVTIQSTDSLWVIGTFSQLKEIIDSFENQWTFLRITKFPLSILLGFLSSLGVILIFAQIVPKSADNVVYNDNRNFIITIIFTVVTVAVASFLNDYIEKVWPEVEIIPGPEHERKIQKQRKYLWVIISLLILPLIINIITKYWP